MAELRVGHEAFVQTAVARAGRRRQQETVRAGAIGRAAVGDIGFLLSERDAVDQRGPVGGEQREAVAVGIERKRCMQSAVGRVAVEPDDEVSPGRNACRLRDAGRKLPLRRFAKVVREVHPPQIDGRIAVVVDLDPVVVLPLRVGLGAAVGRHQLVDRPRQTRSPGHRVRRGETDAQKERDQHKTDRPAGFTRHTHSSLPTIQGRQACKYAGITESGTLVDPE